VAESHLDIVDVVESPAWRVLEAVDLAAEVTKQSAEVLQAIASDGERLSIDDLRHLEGALVQLRADVARCEKTFVEFFGAGR
jgi:hypothetical protein